MKKKEKQEKKIQESFLRPIENKIWPRLAPKVSKILTPMQLTFIALISAFLNGLCFYLTNYNKLWFLGAIFFAFVFWIADALDGEVARYKKVVSKQGFYADHIADMFAILFIFLGLGLSALKFSIALLIIAFYFMITINVLLMTYIENTFRISYGKLGPSECRLILITFSFISLVFPYPLIVFKNSFLGSLTLWDFGGIIAASILFILLITITVNNFIYLKKYEKKYKPKTLRELLSDLHFRLRNAKLADFLNTEPLEKEFKELVELFRKA
ncbi:MAG: CDP-alcohol phosphatidyltransferase family protein [Candidatus Pacearchaeota archaeon]